jgi:hypothetical protein
LLLFYVSTVLTLNAKLMLFAAIASTMGMAIVAGLLSPSGPQTTPRAEAGVTFIYLFMGASLGSIAAFLFHSLIVVISFQSSSPWVGRHCRVSDRGVYLDD